MATTKTTTKKKAKKKTAGKPTKGKTSTKKKAAGKGTTKKTKTNGLTDVQTKILKTLARTKKELGYKEIAEKAGVSYAPLTSVMAAAGRSQSHPDSLEAKGYVVKHEAQEGKRGFVWAITAKGRQAIK